MTTHGTPEEPRRPNVLFIFSDQHNARRMSRAGSGEVSAPHLDRLAREGYGPI